ncbi:hypothetical protein SFOMI_3098 [Sphingobium fuliginis]|uniref:Uncharacterized protein n=1 Tax=Sphingobium fuliginis (strain ATCC 27551) TaxID=336203 RepID=A0A292ZI08_SPHSA|nr:hypothetical protein SFOMI_3098 [Sphingobium fuliginis]
MRRSGACRTIGAGVFQIAGWLAGRFVGIDGRFCAILVGHGLPQISFNIAINLHRRSGCHESSIEIIGPVPPSRLQPVQAFCVCVQHQKNFFPGDR